VILCSLLDRCVPCCLIVPNHLPYNWGICQDTVKDCGTNLSTRLNVITSQKAVISINCHEYPKPHHTIILENYSFSNVIKDNVTFNDFIVWTTILLLLLCNFPSVGWTKRDYSRGCPTSWQCPSDTVLHKNYPSWERTTPGNTTETDAHITWEPEGSI
jgi:hypothetical protein